MKHPHSQLPVSNPSPSTPSSKLTLPLLTLSPSAKVPKRAHADDAGLDLSYLGDPIELQPQQGSTVRTGIAIAVPAGHVGLIADRSSLAKKGIKIAGGIIDAGYRGEIHIVLWNLSSQTLLLQSGERIAQLLIIPIIFPIPQLVDHLDATERGDKGFGSSGR